MARSLREAVSRFWLGLSLRDKLLSFLLALIGSLSLFSLYGYFSAYRHLDEFQATLQGYFGINGFLLELKSTNEQLDRYMREGSLDSLRAYMESRDELYKYLDRIDRESNTSLDTYFLVRALTNSLDEYVRRCGVAILARQVDRQSYFAEFYSAQRVRAYMQDYLTELLNVRLAEGNRYYRDLSGIVNLGRLVGLAMLGAVSLAAFRFAFLFSGYLAKPIMRLAAAAARIAQGDLDVPALDLSSKDEVGDMAHSFNTMSSSIKAMVEDLKEKSFLEKKLHEEELEKESMLRSLREAQLTSLQSRINPHFLFNTLNTIGRTALFEKAGETAALIQSLAGLLRYNLLSHGKTVRLSHELAVVREFMGIQTRRFGRRVRFELDCRVEAEEVVVPPLIIQPFVENSMAHGIEPSEDGGALRVLLRERSGRLRVVVLDSGVGMDRQRLAEVRARAASKEVDGDRGIGIANVVNRLGLHYSGSERFALYSRPGRGTLVALSIPRSV